MLVRATVSPGRGLLSSALIGAGARARLIAVEQGRATVPPDSHLHPGNHSRSASRASSREDMRCCSKLRGFEGPQPIFSIWLHHSVSVEPIKDLGDTPGRESDAAISGSVVQIDTVAIRVERVAARERDITNVAFAFVRGLRSKDP